MIILRIPFPNAFANFIRYKTFTMLIFSYIPYDDLMRVLFENRPALYFSNYKENKKIIHV